MGLLQLQLRKRGGMAGKPDHVHEDIVTIDTCNIAVIVCDMWDQHWCRGATNRVNELAPRMEELLVSLRSGGSLIVHAPSDTMGFYDGTPARIRAQSAPIVTPSCDLSSWRRLTPEREGELPIDDSDGGCDDLPACQVPPSMPWSRQHSAITIHDEDAVSDSGLEVYNVLEQFQARLVLMMGVHTNMCVLGRPFGIRSLVESGRPTALVRDMTDTMYCSRSRPYVDHYEGTQRVIKHIERFWCPTISSDQILGGTPFEFKR